MHAGQNYHIELLYIAVYSGSYGRAEMTTYRMHALARDAHYIENYLS